MSKRVWLNLILVGVVALLAFLLAYQPKINESQQPQRLFGFGSYDANRILIERENQQTILLEKRDKQWLLVEPALAPVNEQRIRHLLTILDEPVKSKLDANKTNLQTFKLEPGKIKLTINDEKLAFGMVNPITKNRYVLKNGSIFTVAEIVYGTLGASVTSLLQHRLVAKGETVVAIEAPQGFLQTPEVLQSWNMLEAIDIADYTGDESILGSVKLTLNNGRKLELDIHAAKPQLVLGRADLKVKYTFSKTETNHLLVGESSRIDQNEL